MSNPKLSQTREYRRELRDLDKAEREATKPLRDVIAANRRWIASVKKQTAANDREITREIKLAEKATAGIRKRRAILEGRMG